MRAPSVILVSRPDRIGDVVISTPCLPVLRRAFPEARLCFLVSAVMRPLLEGIERVDEIWTMPDGADAEKLLSERMREAGVEWIFHLQPNSLVERAAFEAGIHCRVGFRNKHNASWLTHALPYEKKKGLRHESAYAYQLFDLLNVPRNGEEPDRPVLCPDPKARERLKNKCSVKDYGVLHLGVFGTKPRVPADYFVAVAELFKQYGCATVLVGADKDDPDVFEFMSEVQGRDLDIINLYGQLDLAELAFLLKDARAYFSRDTGPAHLAAAMDCPTVTWFLQPNPVMHPNRWKPLGRYSFPLWAEVRQRPWENEHAFARRSLKQISVREVVDVVEKALNAKK